MHQSSGMVEVKIVEIKKKEHLNLTTGETEKTRNAAFAEPGDTIVALIATLDYSQIQIEGFTGNEGPLGRFVMTKDEKLIGCGTIILSKNMEYKKADEKLKEDLKMLGLEESSDDEEEEKKEKESKILKENTEYESDSEFQ